MKRQITSTRK